MGGVAVLVVLQVHCGHAALTVRVGVAGRESPEQDGRLVLDGLILECDSVVFIDSLPPRN